MQTNEKPAQIKFPDFVEDYGSYVSMLTDEKPTQMQKFLGFVENHGSFYHVSEYLVNNITQNTCWLSVETTHKTKNGKVFKNEHVSFVTYHSDWARKMWTIEPVDRINIPMDEIRYESGMDNLFSEILKEASNHPHAH